MARKHLMAAVTAIGLLVAVPAIADMPTIDGTMVGKAIEQIKEMKAQLATELEQLAKLKEQISFLTDISKFVGEVSDAIGALTHITLPIPNINKMAAQIKGDMRCLMPDGVGWGIKFEDLNLASICETSSKYRDALFVDQEKLKKLGFNEQAAARHLAAANRKALLADTSVRALAQGDVQLQQADELNNAADSLQSNLGGAETVQDRLHVQAQAQILQTRALASQNQMLAQMLKLQAAGQIAAGLPADAVACQPAAPAADPLPADDPAAWSYKPAPPPAPPAPPPAPAFAPVVIEKTVIREVPAPVPAPAPAVMPSAPDPFEVAVQAAYRSRSAVAAGWSEITVPASLPGSGAGTVTDRPRMPAMPLDLAATVKVPGEDEYEEKSITSSPPVDNSRIVTTDRTISGILETGINTQLDGTTGGPVVIQTTRDVFGYHGRNILIPKGSRLVCAYKSLDKVGSSRAPLRCSRMLLGGHRAEIYGMKANVTDVQGGLGVSGEVDNRFAERYGTAFILAGVSAAVRAATAGSGAATSSSSASATGSSSTYSDGGALAQGGTELSQRLGEITAATLEQTINLTPILKVAQGTRVQIRPDTDWYIAKVE